MDQVMPPSQQHQQQPPRPQPQQHSVSPVALLQTTPTTAGFFSGGSSTTGGQVADNSPFGGRPFRSRKSRPCDPCRKSKTRCALPSAGPPCLECSQTNKHCTFTQLPPTRKPKAVAGPSTDPATSVSPQPVASSSSAAQPFGAGQPPLGSWSSTSVSPTVIPHMPPMSRAQDPPQTVVELSAVARGKRPLADPAAGEEPASRRRVSPAASAGSGLSHTLPPPQRQHGLDLLAHMVTSLDLSQSDSFEPHVLTAPVTDDLLPISGTEGDHVPDRPHVRQISLDKERPIYVVFSPRSHGRNSAPDPAAALLFRFRSLIASLPADLREESVLRAFITHVHPALPVLPASSVETSPPYLLAAALSVALTLSRRGREIPHVLKVMTLRPDGEERASESSRLSTIAAECLNLDSRFLPDPRGNYLRLAKTIALAQLLGLHLSPLSWAISQEEQFLRIHLWWVITIHDSWTSFLNSRPSHIQASNFEVPLPSLDTLRGAFHPSTSTSQPSLDPAVHDSRLSFIDSCQLALLVGRLQRGICTLEARHLGPTDKLELLDELEDDARALAGRWDRARTAAGERAPGVNSLLLMLSAFRCMLRRIAIEMEASLGGPFVPDEDTLGVFSHAVEFLVGLTPAALDGYWLCYSSHVISSLTSSLIRICLASASAPSSPPSPSSQDDPTRASGAQTASVRSLTLLSSLVVFLTTAKNKHSWDIADAALVRASLVATRLRSLDEQMPIVQALEGQYVSPTAAVDPDLNAELDEAIAAAAMTNWDLEGLDMGWLPWTGPELNTDDLMAGGGW